MSSDFNGKKPAPAPGTVGESAKAGLNVMTARSQQILKEIEETAALAGRREAALRECVLLWDSMLKDLEEERSKAANLKKTLDYVVVESSARHKQIHELSQQLARFRAEREQYAKNIEKAKKLVAEERAKFIQDHKRLEVQSLTEKQKLESQLEELRRKAQVRVQSLQAEAEEFRSKYKLRSAELESLGEQTRALAMELDAERAKRQQAEAALARSLDEFKRQQAESTQNYRNEITRHEQAEIARREREESEKRKQLDAAKKALSEARSAYGQAASVAEQWRKRATGLEAELERANQQAQQLDETKKSLAQARIEMDQVMEEKASLERRNDALEAEVKRLKEVYPVEDLLSIKERQISQIQEELNALPEGFPDREKVRTVLDSLSEQREQLLDLLHSGKNGSLGGVFSSPETVN